MPSSAAKRASVSLLDAGDGRRLERFGARVVDRPHPGAGAPRRSPGRWRTADLRFERPAGWTGRGDLSEPWKVEVAGLVLELRATEPGGLGLFPEQLQNVTWLEAQVATATERRASSGPPPEVLNLFAHTGLLTLVAARAGARVVHLDAARGSVAWARRNANLSRLAEQPIRWLVDDGLAFVAREARRGRSYDGIVLDPPSYGHAGGQAWRLAEDMAELLDACARIARPDAFVLLTAHTPEFDENRLADALWEAFPDGGDRLEAEPLELEAESGARLSLGAAARLRASANMW
ncbi:MAG TPA: class I SAM-dependent methyltransferase [Candidatus Eisenbacteria bacterium]|nr:class I SAM-dependent methyltransferase [Candidatus Eisenbacteria bacterium]